MTKIPHNRVAKALRYSLAAGLAGQLMGLTSGLAQTDTNATRLKTVVVTGSAIPTAETVGPAPVDVINSEEIQKSGTQDVLQMLRKLNPAFTGGGNLGQVANNFSIQGASPAGEANVAIRNLPTLVLIDGRRVANSALSAGQAVDLNTIPLAMIDRVEILKDGASAIYGSDAIGGVVNIITKKNWTGAEIGGRVGFPTSHTSNDLLERRAYVVAGTSTDSSTFTAGASYYVMDPLLAKDRKVASSGIAELAARGITPPSYVSPSYPGRVQAGGVSYILAGSPFAVGAPGYNASIVTPPIVTGGPFAGATAVTAYNAAAQAQFGVTPYIPISSTPVGTQLGAIGQGEPLFPALNTTDFGTISIQKQDRKNVFANFETDLIGKGLQLFANFLYANDHSEAQLAPSPVSSLGINNITIPANNIFNPFGIALGAAGSGTPRIRSRFVDTGNRTFDSETDSYHFVSGLKGEFLSGFNWEAAYNYNRSEQTYYTRNAINGSALNQALTPNADPALAAAGLSALVDPNGNPVPQYNIFATPGNNNPATLNMIRSTLFRHGVSELWAVDGKITGKPFELPAGPFAFAVGGEYINESLAVTVDGLTQLGLVPGLSQESSFSTRVRDRAAAFVEVNIPVIASSMNVPGVFSFDLTAAGRVEKIWPGGTAAVPKFGGRWQPFDEQVTIRGGYSEGFIAPSIYSLYGADSISNPTIPLPNGSGGTQAGQIQSQTRSNPNLPASDSKNWNVGAVYSPKQIPNLTFTVDYYNIEQDKVVLSDPFEAARSLNALGSASPWASGFTFADGTKLTTTAKNQVTVGNFGNVILTNSANGALQTDGFDFGVNYLIPTDSLGKFTLSANANWLLNYKFRNSPSLNYQRFEGLHTQNFGGSQGVIPDYNITAILSWDISDFTFTITGNYIPSVMDLGNLHPTVGDVTHGNTVSGGAWKVPDYYTIDLQIAYELGKGRPAKHWYDHTRFAVGVNNVTDNTAPFIASAIEDNTDKSTYDILGRFVYFEVSKKF